MTHEKDRRAGKTYVEPHELSARERARDTRRRTQADAASGDQQEPANRPASVREDDAPRRP